MSFVYKPYAVRARNIGPASLGNIGKLGLRSIGVSQKSRQPVLACQQLLYRLELRLVETLERSLADLHNVSEVIVGEGMREDVDAAERNEERGSELTSLITKVLSRAGSLCAPEDRARVPVGLVDGTLKELRDNAPFVSR